jgi:hypothetical protein
MVSLLFQAALRRTDWSSQPTRMYMARGWMLRYAMKMGGRPQSADSLISGLKTAILQGLPDAMNMAWTLGATSTMFAALNHKAPHELLER